VVVWKESVALAIDLVMNELEIHLFLHLARQSGGEPVRLGLELGALGEDLAEAVVEGHLTL